MADAPVKKKPDTSKQLLFIGIPAGIGFVLGGLVGALVMIAGGYLAAKVYENEKWPKDRRFLFAMLILVVSFGVMVGVVTVVAIGLNVALSR